MADVDALGRFLYAPSEEMEVVSGLQILATNVKNDPKNMARKERLERKQHPLKKTVALKANTSCTTERCPRSFKAMTLWKNFCGSLRARHVGGW